MKLVRPNTCRNCAHKANEGGELTCRLNPPHVHPIVMPTPGGPKHVANVSAFPSVDGDMWCSQHKRRVVQPGEAAEIDLDMVS